VEYFLNTAFKYFLNTQRECVYLKPFPKGDRIA
jgi:hypothetical protein